MANIKRIEGKTGPSFKITVTRGRAQDDKQIRHYRTWKPDHPMTERQMEKEVQRIAFEFEREISQGFQADDRQTFAEYAQYVLELKEQGGVKTSTLDSYRDLLRRIDPEIGHIRLTDLRPQHLNTLYKHLSAPDASYRGDKAVARGALQEEIRRQKFTHAKLAELAGISAATVDSACKGKNVSITMAEKIAAALGKEMKKLFVIEKHDGPLRQDDPGASPSDPNHSGTGGKGDARALQRRGKSHATQGNTA